MLSLIDLVDISQLQNLLWKSIVIENLKFEIYHRPLYLLEVIDSQGGDYPGNLGILREFLKPGKVAIPKPWKSEVISAKGFSGIP